MAQTGRISFQGSSPSTQYHMGADIIAQSQAGNFSVVRISITAFNTGASNSFSGNQGRHTGAIDGIGQTQRVGTLASGYPNGAVRWDQALDLGIGHDAEGNTGGCVLRQTVDGWHPTNVQAVVLGGFPRIPKKPAPAGVPTFTEVLPTSVRVSFSGSLDHRGSPVDFHMIRYWANPEGTGPYVDKAIGLSQSDVITGLTPGTEYRFVVYVHNNSYEQYSDPSGAAVVRTLSGLWYKFQGAWRRCIPYVKVAGVWRATSAFRKYQGTWHRGG